MEDKVSKRKDGRVPSFPTRFPGNGCGCCVTSFSRRSGDTDSMPITGRLLRHGVRFVVLLLLCGLAACGWRTGITFVSPSGKSRLEVLQPKTWRETDFRVDVIGPSGAPETVHASHHEVFMTFAHVYWAPDESILVFFACGSDEVAFAYHLNERKMLPFESASTDVWRDVFWRDLFRSYGVSDERFLAKPPRSPCAIPGLDAQFRSRYPGAPTAP